MGVTKQVLKCPTCRRYAVRHPGVGMDGTRWNQQNALMEMKLKSSGYTRVDQRCPACKVLAPLRGRRA